jgi:hypothetical protein
LAKFEVLDAVGPDWASLPRERRASLLRGLQEPGWLHARDGRAFGFREFQEYELDLFVGYFAVESRLSYLRYDDSGAPPERSEVEESERVLSLCLIREGRWLLHDRRFFRTDLNKALVRDLFDAALQWWSFDAAISPIQRLQPFQESLTPEQMLERLLAEQDRVLRVTVGELHGRRVPREFRFFNPRFEFDEEQHDFLDEEFRVIDDVALQAEESRDLRDSKLAQGVARAGDVVEYALEDPVGRRRQVRRRVPPSFDIDLDLDDPTLPLPELARLIVNRYMELYPSRYGTEADFFAGGLFDHANRPDTELK